MLVVGVGDCHRCRGRRCNTAQTGEREERLIWDSCAPHFTLDAMDERLAGFVVGDNYIVQDVIGEGAYGIVWSV